MKSSPPYFVVFEGLDGTGKTTCARLTAEHLGAVYMTTPSPTIRQFRQALLDDFDGCQEACQLFYLATVFKASVDVGKLLAAGRSVVLDRYFLSTQAYAEFRSSALAIDDVERHLLPADLTVMLDAPLSVRRARIVERGESDADHETLGDGADVFLRGAHMKRAQLPVAGKLITVDTSLALPTEVSCAVLAELGRLHAG